MSARTDLAEARLFIADAEALLRRDVAECLAALDAHDSFVREEASARTEAARRIVESGHAIDLLPCAQWRDDELVPHVPAELRIGGAVIADGVTIPATIPLFSGREIVLTSSNGAGAERVREVLRGLAVRCVAAMGRRVTLHLIDPHQEGFGFGEREVLPCIAPRTKDAAADLKVAFEAAHADTADDDALHVVLAMDFPRAYSHQAVVQLNRIARLNHGVQLIIHHALDAIAPTGEALELEAPIVADVEGDGTANGAWGMAVTHLDGAPGEAVTRWVAERVPTVKSQEIANFPWSEINTADESRWWGESARDVAIAHVGRAVDGSVVSLEFGTDSGGHSTSHIVLGGTTGSGKSVLLHDMIMSLATRYSTDELNFYLVDGQDGVSFRPYQRLPHAAVVTSNTPVDIVRGILADIGAELTRRNNMLIAARVQEFSRITPPVPRLIVVIDEYQALLDGWNVATEKVLQDITAQGRKCGIHLVLASQGFHAVGLQNQSAIFRNIGTRIALLSEKSTIDSMTEFDREGRELVRMHCVKSGRFVINNTSGSGPCRAGQAALLDSGSGTLESLVDRLQRKAKNDVVPVVIDGLAQPSVATNRAFACLVGVDSSNAKALRTWAMSHPADGGLGAPAWQSYDHPLALLFGRTLSVYGTAAPILRRQEANNVLVVSDDPEQLTGIVQTGLVSAAMQRKNGALSITVLAGTPAARDDSWREALTTRLGSITSQLGHKVQHAETPEDAVVALEKAVTEVQRRRGLSMDDLYGCDTQLVVGVALDRLALFRATEGRYGDKQASPAGELLARLADEGPDVGVHLVLGFDSVTAWQRVMVKKSRDRFLHRTYSQLTAEASTALLDSLKGQQVQPASVDKGPRRMGYSNATSGEFTVFLPYITSTEHDVSLTRFAGGHR